MSSQNSRPLRTQNVLGASESGKGYRRGHGGVCHHLPAESIHLSSDLRPSEGAAELRGDFHFVWEMASPKESGDGTPLLPAPFGTLFLLRSISAIPGKGNQPAGLGKVTKLPWALLYSSANRDNKTYLF